MATIPSIAMIPSGYKASKVYSVLPTDGTGDLTFSRAGALPSFNATRVNSDGLIEQVLSNVPRLDYSDGVCPSLLIEPQSTNLLLRSEEFDNVAWIKYGSLVSSNTVVAPDGTLTGDTAVPPSSTGNFGIGQNILKANSPITYTLSGFSKVAGYDFLIFRIDNGGANGIKGAFNVATATVSTSFTTNGSGYTLIGASITPVGNGWSRWSVSFTTDSASVLRSIIYVSNVTGDGFTVPSYTANGFSGIYIWGAQLEALPYATSYIPTVASTVTRVAETASKTGITDLIGQTEGTIVWDFNVPDIATAGDYIRFILSDGTTSNNISLIFYSTGRIQFTSRVSGSLEASINLPSYGLTDGNHKFALAYKLNDYVAYVDGALVGTDTSAGVPSLSDLNLYDTVGGSYLLNQALVFKTRLSNETLSQLTTL